MNKDKMGNPIRYKKVLGLEEFAPTNKYVCFLPFIGEFGWLIQTFVKRVQGYNHSNKIVCTKQGHECLFPTASHFYYDWGDVEDAIKAGILANADEEIVKNKIKEQYNTDDIYFLSSSETSWEEKETLANHTFIPKSKHNLGLKVDVVIAPRNRVMDAHRNWTQENWQYVVNELVKLNITVGVCGAKRSSFDLENILYKSYDFIDVDTDVELLTNAKLVIVQESGMQYLSFLCERPTFCIDNYLGSNGSDLHRNKNIPFYEMRAAWFYPDILVNEITQFLANNK